MQVSEADDEGESDTKAPPGPSRDKQALPTADAEEKQQARVSLGLRFGSLGWGRQWRRFGRGDP